MPTTLLLLRLLHVLLGVLWVGPVVFFALFLEPTFRSVGPDAGKVMTELMRRRYPAYILGAGILTVLSGIGLFAVNSSAFGADWMHTRAASTYSAGAVFAIVALAIGATVIRPGVTKLVSPGFAQTPEAPALRDRIKVAGRVVSVLLTLAVLCMAVARYV